METNSNWKGKTVDPPQGWRYGFPKEIKEDVYSLHGWLVENGYPDHLAQEANFHVRVWETEE
jgi:hypothetical protein